MSRIDALQDQMKTMQESFSDSLNTMRTTARKTVWAGLGAVAMTQDNILKARERASELTGRFIERGEQVEATGRERLGDFANRTRSQARSAVDRAEGTVSDYSAGIMNASPLPTADDIEAVTRKVNTLSRKVDRLRKEQANGVPEPTA